MKQLSNAAAEQLVIGSIIKTTGAIDLVAEKLGPGDFHEPKAGIIYAAVARLALSGESGGAALVEELRRGGELEMVGGDKAVTYLESKANTDLGKVKEAANIVRDLANKREKAARAYRVAASLASGGDAGIELDALMQEQSDPEGWTELGGIVSAILQGTHRRLEPTLLQRHDGAYLYYENKLNWIQGPPEGMKSFSCKFACVQLMKKGETVVYVDFEESDGTSCAERIVTIALGLGHDIDTVRDWVEGRLDEHGNRDASTRLLFYRAATTGLDTAARAQIVRLVRARSVRLVILDGVASAMSSHVPALDENLARDVSLWLSGFAWPLVSLGAGVICVDHVVKSSQASAGSFSARSARGSGAKLAAVSGSALSCHVLEPGSAWSVGRVQYEVVKDRPGRIKVVSKDGRRYAGILVSTPRTATGSIEVTHLEIKSPEEVAEEAAAKRWDLICAELMSKVLEQAGEPMTKTDIKELLNERRRAKGATGWRNETVVAAFNFLVERGWATMERDGKQHLLGLVKPYLAEYGDQHVEANPF